MRPVLFQIISTCCYNSSAVKSLSCR